MKVNKGLVIGIVILLLLIIPMVSSVIYLMLPVSSGDRTFEIKVSNNDTQMEVLEKLNKIGAIKIMPVANAYLTLKKVDNIKPGTYTFKTKDSVKSMLDKVANGEIGLGENMVKVSIPEGYSIKQISEKLESSGVISSKESFLEDIKKGNYNSYDFLESIKDNREYRLEGYLCPDTYEFKKNSSNTEIINKMLENYNNIYSEKVSKGAKKLGLTEDQVITMASIIEKEARNDEERPVISGVFYNRINKDMKLQSCATVLYALGEHRDKLYNKDLEVDSPYNTYRYKGLPKGPIASPGIKSIEAAVNPAEHDYIYFVLQNEGKHFFTNNYNEFLEVKKQSNSI